MIGDEVLHDLSKKAIYNKMNMLINVILNFVLHNINITGKI